MNMTATDESTRAVELAEHIAGIIAKEKPNVVGAALADLLAWYLARHPEDVREELLELHVETVRDLSREYYAPLEKLKVSQ